jgi:hypothetical protein
MRTQADRAADAVEASGLGQPVPGPMQDELRAAAGDTA